MMERSTLSPFKIPEQEEPQEGEEVQEEDKKS